MIGGTLVFGKEPSMSTWKDWFIDETRQAFDYLTGLGFTQNEPYVGNMGAVLTFVRGGQTVKVIYCPRQISLDVDIRERGRSVSLYELCAIAGQQQMFPLVIHEACTDEKELRRCVQAIAHLFKECADGFLSKSPAFWEEVDAYHGRNRKARTPLARIADLLSRIKESIAPIDKKRKRRADPDQ